MTRVGNGGEATPPATCPAASGPVNGTDRGRRRFITGRTCGPSVPQPTRSMMRSVLAGLALVSLAACGGAPADDAAATTDSTTMAPAVDSATPATVDIVETALGAGSFSTLAQALTAAGLVETLKGPGPFTVFAPTDDAFAKIPPADLQALLADKEALTKVLTYHVVAGNVPSTQVVGMTSATSVATPTRSSPAASS
jgi:hypothetical protein